MQLISIFLLLQVCPFKKMAHRHHNESPDNSTYIKAKLLVPFKPLIVNLVSSSANASLASLQTFYSCSPLNQYIYPYRQVATCETILFPTSSSSSPTVWRCMLTQCRDFTKHCWMTSLRSEQFCFGS